MKFRVTPTDGNEFSNIAEGALAHCWVLENEPRSAQNKSAYFVRKSYWSIEKVETPPVEVTREDFLDRDTDLELYDKAQVEGIAIYFVAYSRNIETTHCPVTLKKRNKFNLNNYVKKQKNLSNDGRCLHYMSGHRCNQIINAHSIQKGQSLSAIAEDGHIYELSSSVGVLKKNKGTAIYEKTGINNVSTFRGFCEKHDNELFSPIDNSPLLPTDEQVFLYAYRSLCRELFIKENAFVLLESQLNNAELLPVDRERFNSLKIGIGLALKDLKRHKSEYDMSHSKQKYDDIRYVLFISKQKPFMAFSGLLFPEFDFSGRQLQNLGNAESELDLIVFCSSVMSEGWGFLFAWHKSSTAVSVEFVKSIATMIHSKKKVDDMLFRLIVSNCENTAISPKWWEKLSPSHKELITSKANSTMKSYSKTSPDYLMEGLEGIAGWDFINVITKME